MKYSNIITGNDATAIEDFNNNVPNLHVFSLASIEEATDQFSIENKLGEGGYGPVYKASFYDYMKRFKYNEFSFSGKTNVVTMSLFTRVYCQTDRK